jgi:hypothetical protein
MPVIGPKRFAFENYGGAYQVRIREADDLAVLQDLDDAFWMATSAPTHQFRCDPELLARLDGDRRGRILSDDMRAAAKWLLECLGDRSGVNERRNTLDLAALDAGNEHGERLLKAARRILENLGQAPDAPIALEDIRNRKAIMARGSQNGDGVIPPENIDYEDLRQFASDILDTMGVVVDLNGEPGVDGNLLEQFLKQARDLLTWHERSASDPEPGQLFPLGETTAAGHDAYLALKGPIDSYFLLCRVAAVGDMLERSLKQPTIDADLMGDQAYMEAYLTEAPLAAPNPTGILTLQGDVNPHYREALATLCIQVLRPLLGSGFTATELTEGDWLRVQEAFKPFEQWQQEKMGGDVEKLGPEKLRAYLLSDLPARLRAMIDADLDAGPELASVEDLEYLILLQHNFLDICNNFVSFPDLFDPNRRAMFEIGRLIMEGLVFNFNLLVRDVEAHAASAKRSGIYLLYSEVTGGPKDTPFHIVTPVANRRVTSLGVNSRGVLFDRDDKEWDVRVVKAVDNPISFKEAIFAPFRRIASLIATAVEKVTAGAEKQLEVSITDTTGTLQQSVQEGMTAPQAAPAAPVEPQAQAAATGSSTIRDLMLAGGVAFAAVGSSFAYIASKFAEMQGQHGYTPLFIALGVGLAIIVVPTALIAFFKLRARNLNGILEASGWAINAHMRLTPRLAAILVQKPPHPKSFTVLRQDLLRNFARTVKRGD